MLASKEPAVSVAVAVAAALKVGVLLPFSGMVRFVDGGVNAARCAEPRVGVVDLPRVIAVTVVLISVALPL